jgi:hypothetical protein
VKFIAYGPPAIPPDDLTAGGQSPVPVAHAGAWLLPAPAQGFGSWSSAGRVHGQPGTEQVPAPAPAAVQQDNAYPQGSQRSSRYAPDAIYPALYYQASSEATGPNGSPGIIYNTSQISRVSDNALPVPAVDPRGLPAVMVTPPPKVGGQGTIGQPYAVQNWPKWVGTV